MEKRNIKGMVGLILFISGLTLMILSMNQGDNSFSLIGFIIMMCSIFFIEDKNVDHENDGVKNG